MMMNKSAVMPMMRHSLSTDRRVRFWGMVSIGSMMWFYTLQRAELRQIERVFCDSLFPIRKRVPDMVPNAVPNTIPNTIPGASPWPDFALIRLQ